MDPETKKLLTTIIANQVVLYKKLDILEKKSKGISRMAAISSYAEELHRESEQVSEYLRNAES